MKASHITSSITLTGGRCVGMTMLPSACADCLEILGASTAWSS